MQQSTNSSSEISEETISNTTGSNYSSSNSNSLSSPHSLDKKGKGREIYNNNNNQQEDLSSFDHVNDSSTFIASINLNSSVNQLNTTEPSRSHLNVKSEPLFSKSIATLSSSSSSSSSHSSSSTHELKELDNGSRFNSEQRNSSMESSNCVSEIQGELEELVHKSNRSIDLSLGSTLDSNSTSENTSNLLSIPTLTTTSNSIQLSVDTNIPAIRTKISSSRSMNRVRSSSYSTPSSHLDQQTLNSNHFININNNNNLENVNNIQNYSTSSSDPSPPIASTSARYLDRESHWLSEDEGGVGSSGGSNLKSRSKKSHRDTFNSTSHSLHSIHHRPSLVRASTEPTTPTTVSGLNPSFDFIPTSTNINLSESTTTSAPQSFDQLLPNLLQLLTCSKCTNLLKDPTTLPCGHSQCLNCTSVKISDLNTEEFHSESKKNISSSTTIKCFVEGCKGRMEGGKRSRRLGRVKSNYSGVEGEARLDYVLQKLLSVLSSASASANGDEITAMEGIETITSNPISVDSVLNTYPTLLVELQSELECQVCVQLYYNPITTPCGHTYCQKCLARSLDHSDKCAMCRSDFPSFTSFQTQPINQTTSSIIALLFPSLLYERKVVVESEEQSTAFNIPIFVCTLAWPNLPTYIHIFEPRYRLMMRRVMESPRRQFGMVLPSRTGGGTAEYGTMLEVQSWNMIEDGRSIVETIGTYRFRLLEKDTLDGYTVGRVERVDDISDEQEGELERIALARNPPVLSPVGIVTATKKRRSSIFSLSPSPTTTSSFIERPPLPSTLTSTSPSTSTSNPSGSSNSNNSFTAPTIELSTDQLMTICLDFIQTLRTGSAPWVLQRLNNTVGPMPTNPCDFSFWMAEVLPVDDQIKATLLQITSPRERLRLIVFWIEQFRSSWWFSRGCSVM